MNQTNVYRVITTHPTGYCDGLKTITVTHDNHKNTRFVTGSAALGLGYSCTAKTDQEAITEAFKRSSISIYHIEHIDIKVGQQVRIVGCNTLFTVTEIVNQYANLSDANNVNIEGISLNNIIKPQENHNTEDHNTGCSNTRDHNTGYQNTGHNNTGNQNTGNWNTGHQNTGYWNTGSNNTRDRNTGDRNTGDRNTGYQNTGHNNTGDRNTSHSNTGYRNTGNHNTGNHNTGSHNTGYWNTGSHNTGYWNTGDYNTGSSNTGFFNTETPKPTFFDKPTDLTWEEAWNLIPKIGHKPLTEWVETKDMTDQEKKDHPTHTTTGGYLKINKPFKEQFKELWPSLPQKTKDMFLNLPNFNVRKFLECTGVDIQERSDVKITHTMETVVVDGVTYGVHSRSDDQQPSGQIIIGMKKYELYTLD